MTGVLCRTLLSPGYMVITAGGLCTYGCMYDWGAGRVLNGTEPLHDVNISSWLLCTLGKPGFQKTTVSTSCQGPTDIR